MTDRLRDLFKGVFVGLALVCFYYVLAPSPLTLWSTFLANGFISPLRLILIALIIMGAAVLSSNTLVSKTMNSLLRKQVILLVFAVWLGVFAGYLFLPDRLLDFNPAHCEQNDVRYDGLEAPIIEGSITLPTEPGISDCNFGYQNNWDYLRVANFTPVVAGVEMLLVPILLLSILSLLPLNLRRWAAPFVTLKEYGFPSRVLLNYVMVTFTAGIFILIQPLIFNMLFSLRIFIRSDIGVILVMTLFLGVFLFDLWKRQPSVNVFWKTFFTLLTIIPIVVVADYYLV